MAKKKKAGEKPTKKKSPSRKSPSPAKKHGTKSAYQKHLDRVRANDAARTRAGQEIGPLPPIKDPDRRASAKESLLFHLQAYHGKTFFLPFATYHYELIDCLEQAILGGGWYAFAVPRSGGKTVLCESAIQWAVLHGHRKFPLVVGSTDSKGKQRLSNIKTELRVNETLLEDFPEVCWPINRVDDSSRRVEGQRLNDNRTAMKWNSDFITLPTVNRSSLPDNHPDKADDGFTVQSGSTIAAAGLTADIRGWSLLTETLERLRPDIVLCDDPQTKESAKSAKQVRDRLELLVEDIAYLGGPDIDTPVVVPCTVIRQGDLADQILDDDANPEWQGVRRKMLTSYPSNMDLWDTYAEIRRRSKQNRHGPSAENEFYRSNREAMDEGASVSWPERFKKNELSAIQSAMNLKLKNENAFLAEAQNEPVFAAEQDDAMATPQQIVNKLNGLKRNQLPRWAERVVGFVDVHKSLLYYVCAAVDSDFQGAFIDYGTEPDQRRDYFTMSEVRHSIESAYRGSRADIKLRQAVSSLVKRLAETTWQVEDGSTRQTEQILVDCGWSPEPVFEGIRMSGHASIAMPSKGFGTLARDTPLHERKLKEGERAGHHWLIKSVNGIRQVHFCSNHWKTEAHRSILAVYGEPGSFSLWSDEKARHQMFADHWQAETCEEDTDRGRSVLKWKLRSNKPDNHFFDASVGCLVAASISGSQLGGAHAEIIHNDPPPKPPAPVYRLKTGW